MSRTVVVEKLAEPAIELIGELIPENVPNSARRAQTIGSLSRILKAGLQELAFAGKISEGEVNDEKKLAEEAKAAVDAKIPATEEPTPSQLPPPDSEEFKKLGREEQERAMKLWIAQIYDKEKGMPLVTPPPPLEEYRGKVFWPPLPDAPLEQQLPQVSERQFTAPDPLMRSAPVPFTPVTEGIDGPTTNVPPVEGEVKETVIEEGKVVGIGGEQPVPPPDPGSVPMADKEKEWI